MSGVVKWENPPLDDEGMRNVPVGDKMSACIAWAACAICLDSDGPGNESRRRPANHEEVELSGVKAVSLDSDRLTDKFVIPIIHLLVYESRNWNFIVQILHLPVRKQRERKGNKKPSLLLEFANQNFDTGKEVRLPASIDRATLTVIDR